MTRHGIRFLASYAEVVGTDRWTGHVTDLGNTTAEQCEEIRRAMPNGAHVDVVALDAAGQVIEP